jgi:hypothetical protein
VDLRAVCLVGRMLGHGRHRAGHGRRPHALHDRQEVLPVSKATKAEMRRAEKARRNERRQRRRSAARRRSRGTHGRPTEPELSPWPDTTGLSEEDAARVWGEFFYWEDYHDRNPDSTFCAPI